MPKAFDEEERRDLRIAEAQEKPMMERIMAAIEDADLDFWATISDYFPEVTTGDLDPLTVHRFEQAQIETVRDWLYANLPGLHSHAEDAVSYDTANAPIFTGLHAHPFEEGDAHVHHFADDHYDEISR